MGHTHEDVDQMFSQIRRKLQRKQAETLPKLLSLLPNSHEVTAVFDIKSWLTPYLSHVTGHTKPHHFKFSNAGGGKVVTSFKGITRHDWTDLQTGFLQQSSNGQTLYPSGKPGVVAPQFTKIDLERLTTRVDNWVMLFSDDASEQCWKTYITKLIQVRDNQRKKQQYMSQGLIWAIPKIPRFCSQNLLDREDGDSTRPDIAPQLQRQLDEELHLPQVCAT